MTKPTCSNCGAKGAVVIIKKKAFCRECAANN